MEYNSANKHEVLNLKPQNANGSKMVNGEDQKQFQRMIPGS